MRVTTHKRLNYSTSYDTNKKLNRSIFNSNQKKRYKGRNNCYEEHSISKCRSFSTMTNSEQIVIPPLKLFDSVHILHLIIID